MEGRVVDVGIDRRTEIPAIAHEEHARKIKELAGTLFQMIIAPRIVWRGHKGTNRARRILKFNPKRVSPMGSSRHAGEKEADRKLVDQFWSDATDER